MKIREMQIFKQSRRLFLLFDYLIWFFLDPSKFTKIEKVKIKKVLIVHLGAIGEILTVTPTISALKRELNCEVQLMVEKGKENILKENPHVSKILIYEYSFESNLINIKKENFDLAILLNPGSLKMALLCLLAGINYRIGGFSGLKRFPAIFYTRRSYPTYRRHAVQSCLDVIRQINIISQNPKLEFYYSDESKEAAEKKLSDLNVKKFIIVHPAVDNKIEHSFRIWPARRYHEVINYLIENNDFDILMTGTKEEEDFSKEIYKGIKDKDRVRLINGVFNFEELAHVVSKSKLLIGPGTSITQLAASFNIPIVDLIPQRRDLHEWYPWMEKGRYKILFSNKIVFNPNVPKRFANEGLLEITQNDVIDAANKLLKLT